MSYDRKKPIYCGNCGRKGHTYRYCREPVISLGVLLFYEGEIPPPKATSTPEPLSNLKPPPTPSTHDRYNYTASKPISIAQTNRTRNESFETMAYSPSPPSSYFSDLMKSQPMDETRSTSSLQSSLQSSSSLFSLKESDPSIKFLLICRKDTFGYVEFIRGRYDVNDETYLTQLFREMSRSERLRLQQETFETLWNRMWINQKSQQYRHEFERSKKSFQIISSPDFPKNLSYYDKKIPCLWNEPEWGIPKGRRNLKESDLQCAQREFLEETGIDSTQYTILNTKPIEETFVGTNDIRYKHIYYLARCKKYIDIQLDKNNLDQMAEVSKIGWFNLDQAVGLFRPYNIEKIAMLKHTNRLLIDMNHISYGDQKYEEI